MDSRPEIRDLLHDVRSRSANLKSAAELLRKAPDGEAVELLDLMVQETRDILESLLELKKMISPTQAP